MIKFYEVTLSKFGHDHYHVVIGTAQQANDWAIKEASANGCTYNVKYLCTDTLDNIKNISNT